MDADFVERAVPPVVAAGARADVEPFRWRDDVVELLRLREGAVHVELRGPVRVVNHRQINVARTGADAARRVLELALAGRSHRDFIDALLLGQFPSGRLVPVRHAGDHAGVLVRGAVVFRPGGDGERAARAERRPLGVHVVAERRVGGGLEACADAEGRGGVARRGGGGVRDRQAVGRLLVRAREVPDGVEVRAGPDVRFRDGGERRDVLHAVIHREGRRRSGNRRDAHPDEGLARDVPRVDLVGDKVSVRVREAKIGAVRRTVGIVEAVRRIRREPHEDGEVRERRRSGIARDRHHALLREECRVELRRVCGERSEDCEKHGRGQLFHSQVPCVFWCVF